MKNTTHIPQPRFEASSSPRFQSRSFLPVVAILLLLLATQSTTFAGSATWKANPGSDDWNTAANWSPANVPNGPNDTATFATSGTTDIHVNTTMEIAEIIFEPGASAFDIKLHNLSPMIVRGAGITNLSGTRQRLSTEPTLGFGNEWRFVNDATAGDNVLYKNNRNGRISFHGTATAGNATFINHGPRYITCCSGIYFFNNTNAGSATFINRAEIWGTPALIFFGGKASAASATFISDIGSVIPQTIFDGESTAANATFLGDGGDIQFGGNSTAANSTLMIKEGGSVEFYANARGGNCTINNQGGSVTFYVDATAGEATITNTDISATEFFGGTAGNCTLILRGNTQIEFGTTVYFYSGDGGTARIVLLGNGALDISESSDFNTTTGSIEGNGVVALGGNNLSVGSNNFTAAFTGMIRDGGYAGNEPGGSFTKIGTGTLTLTNANTYTGGTTITRGKLLVNNTNGSGTGTGAVQVNGGRLGGTGTIAGVVTVGNGTGRGAFLSPGKRQNPGTLTIQSSLTFNSDATYKVHLNTTRGEADKVRAKGVTINSGAQFSFVAFGSGALTTGTVFTVINNTAATPIAGSFANLPDGSTFSNNGNNYQVDYQGGNGNDLTLTVMP